jgi:hypothetical protein
MSFEVRVEGPESPIMVSNDSSKLSKPPTRLETSDKTAQKSLFWNPGTNSSHPDTLKRRSNVFDF